MYLSNSVHQLWLETFVAQAEGVAGTVHIPRGNDLYLTAAFNIPTQVIEIVAHLPHGKGMAGLAQASRRPVQTCDLQTETSGQVRPGARAVDAQAAIALPVLNRAGQVTAVVGIAWNTAGAVLPATEQTLMKLAMNLPQPIGSE